MIDRACRWEPKESFEGGSEHFIEEFWSREIRGLNGRDPNQTFQFRHGEELVAVGPLGAWYSDV